MSEQPDTRIEKGRVEASAPAFQQGQSSLRRLSYAPALTGRAPSPKSYPPISGIPKTSPERLALASADEPPSTSAKTILYLAYGSNLCAETFLGRRGIRPLSQVNVSAPELDLCFDLPGIPYLEPCFANSRRRRITKKPAKLPPSPPQSRNNSDDDDDDDDDAPPGTEPKWTKGLYGVVYEVTPEDYATIIKTEGGGQGYQDVLTPCFELPSDSSVPEKNPKSDFPDLPQPFLAHTLFAPSAIDNDDDDDDDDPVKDDEEDRGATASETTPLKEQKPRQKCQQPPFPQRLFDPVHRHFSDYAEPSARYLKLIRDGAREHALPAPYQTYLAKLTPYAVTTARQRVGRVAFAAFAFPLLLPVFVLGRLLADDLGRTPRWVGAATTACLSWLWAAYDVVFRPLFGDGERTVPTPAAHEQGRGDGRILAGLGEWGGRRGEK